MDKNLDAYIKVYKGLVPGELCDQTIEQLQIANWAPEEFYQIHTGDSVSPTETLDITEDAVPNNPHLISIAWKALESYITRDVKLPWHTGWEGFSAPKYNRYSKTHAMQLHCDHIKTLFDGYRKGIPVLTILFLLNDDFEGGEFIMFEDKVIELHKGDVLVFPSNFMFPHKVSPVTSGVRYSAVCWSW